MNRIHKLDPDFLIACCLAPSEVAALTEPEIQSALRFMIANLDGDLTVRKITDEQNISRRTLELRFQKHLRCTVQKMLTRLRVTAATRLLRETELSISDISVDVGFSSPSRLSHALKRILATTATEIRKSAPQKQQQFSEHQ